MTPAGRDAVRTPLAHPKGLTYGTWLRPSTHLLDSAGTQAVLVEFLDFECEACGGLYPVMEQLRQDLRGKMTFAIRYLPLDGHRNSRPAAYAAEAAARQGKLQQMYSQLFRNQTSWAEQQSPVDNSLRSYAKSAGVDLGRWDADRRSTSVARRVDADAKDAMALKLQGTPSFFFNGKPFRPQSPEEIRGAVTRAAG
jgi:protein-disulfide isomerase